MTTLLIVVGIIFLVMFMLIQLSHLDKKKEQKQQKSSQIRTYDNIAKRNAALRLKNQEREREWAGLQRFAKVAK